MLEPSPARDRQGSPAPNLTRAPLEVGLGEYPVLEMIRAPEKISMLPPFETCGFFNTKTKGNGNRHVQGNVQVYNVRIPVDEVRK